MAAKVNIELFLGQRLGVSNGGSGGVIVRIAAATAAVSMAVMIVAVAVIMGFREEISSKIAAFAGHIRVIHPSYLGMEQDNPIETDYDFEANVARTDRLRSIDPYATKGGLIRTNEATHGVILKGVGPKYDLSFFEKCLVEGALPLISDSVRHKQILISAAVSNMLRLKVGDRVEMLFVGSSAGSASGVDGLSAGSSLGSSLGSGGGSSGLDGLSTRRDRMVVSGIYNSGLGEMDDKFVLTELASVQRLNGWTPTQISGYEIVTDNIEHAPQLADRVAELAAQGGLDLDARAVTDDYPQLFDWLETHNVNAAVIITIMIAVALVSMISALLIIILEQIRTIGILKTLGMQTSRIRRIFVIRAARILLTGLMWGNLFGILMAMLQRYTGVVTLDSSGYFLAAVPVSLSVWWLALLNVGTMAVITALMMVPTSIIGRVSVSKSIRYQ